MITLLKLLAHFVTCVSLTYLFENKFGLTGVLETISLLTSVVSGIALVVAVIVLVACYTGLDGYIEENYIRYETLVWQFENDVYENDNDLGKRELIKDIQDWNEDLAWYSSNEKDFWIGIFIPDIYDQFEFVKLEGLK